MLSDSRKAKILLDYMQSRSYRATAGKFGVSPATVRKVVSENPILKDVLEAMRGNAPQSSQIYLQQKQELIYGTINKCLSLLNDDEKLQSATLPQIASAMSTLFEKFALSGDSDDDFETDPLSESLMELGRSLNDSKADEQSDEYNT